MGKSGKYTYAVTEGHLSSFGCPCHGILTGSVGEPGGFVGGFGVSAFSVTNWKGWRCLGQR
jgi:hypothetical protein